MSCPEPSSTARRSACAKCTAQATVRCSPDYSQLTESTPGCGPTSPFPSPAWHLDPQRPKQQSRQAIYFLFRNMPSLARSHWSRHRALGLEIVGPLPFHECSAMAPRSGRPPANPKLRKKSVRGRECLVSDAWLRYDKDAMSGGGHASQFRARRG